MRLTRCVFLFSCLNFGMFVCVAAQSPSPLTNANVIAMVKSGATDDSIISAIKAGQSHFDLAAPALASLKNNGVSAQVIDAMSAASTKERQAEQSQSKPAGGPASASPLGAALDAPATNGTPPPSSPRGAGPMPNPAASNPQTSADPNQKAEKAPLGGALDAIPHSSPQEILAGKHILVSTVDVIDLAGVNDGRMFRAEIIAGDKVEAMPPGSSVYLKVVPVEPGNVSAGTANEWVALNVTVDHVQYGQTSVAVSSNVQRLHVRTSPDSTVRGRDVKWPLAQVEIIPKTRLSYSLRPAAAQPEK